MKKQKRKLTAAEKAARKRRRAEYMTIFIGGKQKRVKRPPTVEELEAEEFIRRNASPLWWYQNEMWEELYELEMVQGIESPAVADEAKSDSIPF